jgi:hypothetical protein
MSFLQGGVISVKAMTGCAAFQDHPAVFLARGALQPVFFFELLHPEK